MSSIWSDLSNSTSCNWSLDYNATQDAGNIPGLATDVIFSAATQSGNNVATTLGANFIINSLNVNAAPASTTIGNPGDSTTLTINALADSNTNSSGYAGNPAGNGISVAATAGPLTINVPVVLGNSQTWTNSSTGALTLNGNIQGTAATGTTQTLTLSDSGGGTTIGAAIANGTGGGTLSLVVNNASSSVTQLYGANTYSGTTTVENGTLALGNTAALQNSTFDASGAGTLSFGTLSSAVFGGLQGAATSTLVLANSNSFPITLAVGNNNSSTTFSGALNDNGAGSSLAMVGTGTLTLAGNNNYNGATLISARRAFDHRHRQPVQQHIGGSRRHDPRQPGRAGLRPRFGNQSEQLLGSAHGRLWLYRNGPGRRVVHHERFCKARQPRRRIIGDLQPIGRHGIDQRRRFRERQSFPDHRRVFGGNEHVQSFGRFAERSQRSRLPGLGGQRQSEHHWRYGIIRKGLLRDHHEYVRKHAGTYRRRSTVYWFRRLGSRIERHSPDQLGQRHARRDCALVVCGPLDANLHRRHELRYHRRQHHLDRRDFRQRRHDGSRREHACAGHAGATLSNSFSGNIVVSNSSTLEVNGTANSTNPTATPLGDAQLANRAIIVNNGSVLQFTQGNVLGGGGSTIVTPLVINNGGLVNDTANNGTGNNVLGPVTLSGGTLAGGSGGASGKYLTYQLTAGSVTVNTAPSLMVINGSTNPGFNMGQVGLQTTTFNVGLTGTGGTVSSYPDLTVEANLGDLPQAVQYSGSPAFSATLLKIGLGTLFLGASDSYSGGTIVNAGVLQLGNQYALGSGALAANGGTLDLAGYSVIVPSFSGASGTVTSSSGVAALAVNQSNITTFSGTLTDGSGQLCACHVRRGRVDLERHEQLQRRHVRDRRHIGNGPGRRPGDRVWDEPLRRRPWGIGIVGRDAALPVWACRWRWRPGCYGRHPGAGAGLAAACVGRIGCGTRRVAREDVETTGGYSTPFVLGTPVMRASGSRAMRRARAADLNMPSAM